MLKKHVLATMIAAVFVSCAGGPGWAYLPADYDRQTTAGVELRPSYGPDRLWLLPSVTPMPPALTVTEPDSLAIPSPKGAKAYGLFGSVAMPMATLPAAKKWRAVLDNTLECEAACETGIGLRLNKAIAVAAAKPALEGLYLVNSSVNNLIRYRSDGADQWSTAAQTIAAGAGDCEDFAITKMWMLRSMGYSGEQLQMVVLRNQRSGAFHAVLAVHMGGESYVLDNLSNRVLTEKMLKNYVPIQSFAGNQAFLHGVTNKTKDIAALR